MTVGPKVLKTILSKKHNYMHHVFLQERYHVIYEGLDGGGGGGGRAGGHTQKIANH